MRCAGGICRHTLRVLLAGRAIAERPPAGNWLVGVCQAGGVIPAGAGDSTSASPAAQSAPGVVESGKSGHYRRKCPIFDARIAPYSPFQRQKGILAPLSAKAASGGFRTRRDGIPGDAAHPTADGNKSRRRRRRRRVILDFVNACRRAAIWYRARRRAAGAGRGHSSSPLSRASAANSGRSPAQTATAQAWHSSPI